MDKTFKRNFLKGSAAASIGQISSMVFLFISITILARTMQVKEFGLYSLILAITYLFNTVGSFGLEITLVKFITNEEKDARKFILFPVLFLKLITTLFFCLIFYVFSDFILSLFDKDLNNYAFSITVLIFLGSFRDVFYNLLQGLNLFKNYAIVQTLSPAIRTVLILALIFYSVLTFNSLVQIELLTTAMAIVSLILVIPFKNLFNFTSDLVLYKKIIKFTLPVYFNNIFSVIYGRSNLFLIGIFLSPSSVAFYDVASKIPEALKKLFNSFILVYFPNLSKLLSKSDTKSAIDLMNKSISIFSIVLALLVFFSFAFSKEITLLLFSNKYESTSIAFAFLMFNFLLRASATIMGYTILSAGRPEIPMKVNVFTSIISLSGTILLIPVIGYIGAVYSLLLMNIISLFQYYYYLHKLELHLNLKKFLKPLSILLIFGLILYFIPDARFSIILKAVISLLYIFVNYLFIEEVKSLLKNVRKIIPKFI